MTSQEVVNDICNVSAVSFSAIYNTPKLFLLVFLMKVDYDIFFLSDRSVEFPCLGLGTLDTLDEFRDHMLKHMKPVNGEEIIRSIEDVHAAIAFREIGARFLTDPYVHENDNEGMKRLIRDERGLENEIWSLLDRRVPEERLFASI